MDSLFRPISNNINDINIRHVVTPNNENNNNLDYLYEGYINNDINFKYVYPNGDIYIGQFYVGKYGVVKHGNGKLITPFRIHNGNFRNDEPQGFGELDILDHSDGIIKFSGFFNSDDDTRQGFLLFPCGTTFHGEFKNNFAIKTGTYTFSEFAKVKVNLKITSMQGKFVESKGTMITITYEDGNIYIGNTLGWMRHGKGKLIKPPSINETSTNETSTNETSTNETSTNETKLKSEIYKGWWFNDLFYKGSHLHNHHIYEGEFRVNRGKYVYHGKGIIFYKNGMKHRHCHYYSYDSFIILILIIHSFIIIIIIIFIIHSFIIIIIIIINRF